MKMKVLFFTVLVALFASNLPAQPGDMKGGSRHLSQADRERIEAMINWKLIEYLELDDETSEKLLPLMKKYGEERHQTFIELRKVVSELNDLSENEGITKKDAKKELKKLDDLYKQMYTNRKSFFEKAESFLNDRQYIRLQIFEERMKGDVMRQFRDRREKEERENRDVPEN